MLLKIQKSFNNSICFTKTTINEKNYDFILNQIMNLLKTFFNITVNQTRREITNAIVFSQINFKIKYDNKHKSIQFNIKICILLRLHREYNILIIKILKIKLFQQFVKLFKILKKIDRLIYKLKVFEN